MAIDAEETMQILERFTKLKQRDIPKELEDYLSYVAKTGDTVYTWANVKYLYREKLIHVIKDFHESTVNIDDLPQYPNVDLFNYETMKSSLLERLDLFHSAPFTVQRLSELLTEPRKQYSRIDKFMRALEKNILVVSTVEPGRKQVDSENGDSLDSVVNGDLSLVVNVDLDMENESIFASESQPNLSVSVAVASTTTVTSTNNMSSDDVGQPNSKILKLESDEDKTKSEEAIKDDKEFDQKQSTNENEVETTIGQHINKECNENLKCEEVTNFLNEEDSKEHHCENKTNEPEKLVEKNDILDDAETNEALISSQEDKLINIDQLVSSEILTDIQEDNLLNVEDILNPEENKDIEQNILGVDGDEAKTEDARNENIVFEGELSVQNREEKTIEVEDVGSISPETTVGTKQFDIIMDKPDIIKVALSEVYEVPNVIENKIPEQMSIEETSSNTVVGNIIAGNILPQDVNIAEDFDKSSIADQPMDENIDDASAGDNIRKFEHSKVESSMDVDDSTSQEAMDQ